MSDTTRVRESLRLLLGLLTVTSLAVAACRSTPSSADGTLALETHRFT